MNGNNYEVWHRNVQYILVEQEAIETIMPCKNLNKETLFNIEEIKRLIWFGRKIGFLAHITLLNCMQDDPLIEYKVYQTAHEI